MEQPLQIFVATIENYVGTLDGQYANVRVLLAQQWQARQRQGGLGMGLDAAIAAALAFCSLRSCPLHVHVHYHTAQVPR